MRSKTKIDTREAWSHKHDFPIEEVGNTNKAIARLIVPHLQAFTALDKYGSPPNFTDIRQWNNTIQKMIDAFGLLMQDKVYSEEGFREYIPVSKLQGSILWDEMVEQQKKSLISDIIS